MNKDYDLYLKYMRKLKIYSNSGNLDYYLKFLFSGIEFTGANMLDIGGGSGIFTFFGGVKGLQKGVCLEPQSAGSTTGASKVFHDCSKFLGLKNVELIPAKILDYSPFEKFDIILLHNSINHLDEEACINLLTDQKAQDSYEIIFQHIDKLASPNARLIIVDCSRHNFFSVLKLRNPLAPDIEWQKHHAPEVWSQMLSKHHFIKPEIRWNSFNTFRGFDRIFLANRVVAFLASSKFCLRMQHIA